MKLLLTCLTSTLLFVAQAQTGPGGVGNTTSNRMWYAGDGGAFIDAGVTQATNGQQVQRWNDISGNGNHANQTTAGNRPLFHSNSANGKPGLRFTGNLFIDGPSPGITSTSGYTYLMVFRDTSSVNGGTNDGNGTFILDRPTATNELVSLKPVTGNLYFYQKRNNAGGGLGGTSATTNINTTTKIIQMRRNYNVNYQIHYNGALQNTLADADGATTPPQPRIGRHATTANGGIRGYINEFIVYNFALNTAQTIIVNNYLAAKYGLTLGANDVYTMDNLANGNYDHEAAGIGRVDASNIHDDARGTSFVRMNTPSDLSDGEYLMWGHDNGNITANNTVDVDGTVIESRLNRIWRVSKLGDLGTVTVTFDFSTFSSLDGNDLRLLIDRDGDGFADNDVTPATGTVVGSTITFSLVNFLDGDRFTLGSINAFQSPLPIELIFFEAKQSESIVMLNWRTASELNNDFFTIERSLDGHSWHVITKLKGAGTSNHAIDYQAYDKNPHSGLQYYRLKQTDFDGTYKYSKSVTINFSGFNSDAFVLYPNPASEYVEVISTENNLLPITVRLYSASGQFIVEHTFANGNNALVPLNDLKPGSYYVIIKQGNLISKKTFVRL